MEYAKKTPIGYKIVSSPSDGGHVILTHDEYIDILTQKDKAEMDKVRAQKHAEDIKKDAERKVAKRAKEAEERAEKEIRDTKEEVDRTIQKLQKMIEHERSLNKNLRRIATERANKSRHLDKNDEGYMVLNWQPFEYRQVVKNGRKTEVILHNLFKITIQTPWDCSLPEEQIDRLVTEAMHEKALVITDDPHFTWYLRNVNLTKGIESMREDTSMILTRQYRSNVKEGLWEVTLITNFEPVLMERHRSKYV